MSPFSLLLLVSFSLLGQGRRIAGEAKLGDPDTFPDNSLDILLNAFPDTVLDTSPDTSPDTYLNTYLWTASENFLNRSKR